MVQPLIIKLHGCSGAGKTTATKALMAAYGTVYFNQYPTTLPNGKIKSFGYANVVPHKLTPSDHMLYTLGEYDRPGCGGTDTIPSYLITLQMLDELQSRGHVLYEGLLLSTYYGAPGQLTEKYGDRHVFAFLDTPVDLCVERVRQRREAAGSKNKFDPQLTIDKWNTIQRLKARVQQMGRRVVTIPYNDPVDSLMELLHG